MTSRPLAAVLAAALVAVLGPVARGATPAAAATTPAPDPLPVTLTSLAPLVPEPGDTLTITGSVTNTTTAPVRRVDVRLRVSPTPVRNRSEIPQILAGEAGRTGQPVDASRTTVADALEPGATQRFTLSVPLADLALTTTRPEVVVIGVESLGDVANDGSSQVQTGFVRTFLPWFPDPGAVVPTRVVWLYPLSTAPARGADGVFLDDHLAAEIGPGGRLSRILDAAATPTAQTSVSWVVDPQLLEALSDMARGYQVRAPGGQPTAGTGQAAAAAFLARLTALPAAAEITASAYGDPDIVALHRAGLDVDVALASTAERVLPSRVLGRTVTGGLAWPQGGWSDDGTLDVVRAAGARAVVLTGAQLPPSPPVTYTPSGSVDLASGGSPLRAAAFDPVLTPLVSTSAGRDPVGRRQQALAQLAMITLELPQAARTIVLAPDQRWSPDPTVTRDLVASLSTSPWARPGRLDALLAAPASAVPRARGDYPDSARARELRPAYLAQVAAARDDLAALRAVAPDTAGTTTSGLEAALTRAESAAWRSAPATGRRLLATTTATVAAQTAAVHVLSKAPVTLPGDSGVIPVTVANDLDRPARVGISLVGTPAVRFEALDVAPVTIAPGQKQTLSVRARVVGTGPVTVDIRLLTPEGRPFGDAVRTQVTSAAYARAAQWVVGGLFGILVLLLGVNFVRRRRTPAPEQVSTATAPTDDPVTDHPAPEGTTTSDDPTHDPSDHQRGGTA